MNGLALLVACGGAPKAPPEVAAPVATPSPSPAPLRPTLAFAGIGVPGDALTRKSPAFSESAVLDGRAVPIGYHVLARSLVDGFGAVPTRGGAGTTVECAEQDFDSLLLAGGKPWLVSHFECVPGATFLSSLTVDGAGRLSVTGSRPVDWDAWGGLWFPCAGQVSPWGTHLGSEEYEPDASALKPDHTLSPDEYEAWAGMARWAPGERLNPWHYGWPTEIALAEDGTPSARKHYAMGRFSHELSFVLPDRRTVYQSDDGTATGFYLFVADTAGDLGAGHLYAASFAQEGEALATRWVPLGHATHAEIAAVVDAKVPFSALFERRAPEGGACADGFRRVLHSYGDECLRLAAPSAAVPDPAKAASRLETRRYAAYLGAATELEKFEGVTHDPETDTVYLAMTSIKARMLAEDGAPSDQVHLERNPCGIVYGGSTAGAQHDTTGALIPSDHVVVKLSPVVVGRPLSEPDAAGNGCDPEAIANPDNLTLLPGYGLLTIAEDTKWKKGHTNASLWTFDVRSGALTRILSAPVGGEVTGIHWIPDLLGHGYLTAVVQHPWEELQKGQTIPDGVTLDDKRALTGYFGPFPSLKTP